MKKIRFAHSSMEEKGVFREKISGRSSSFESQSTQLHIFFLSVVKLPHTFSTWRIIRIWNISVQTLCGRTAQRPSRLLNVTMAVCHQSIWNPSHNYQASQSINGVSNTLDSNKHIYWSGSSVWPIDCVYLHMVSSMLHGCIFQAFMSIVSFCCI